MSEDDAYLDVRPRSPHTDVTRKKFRQDLTQRFDRNLPKAIERIWELPCLTIPSISKPYSELLIEARELFEDGHFYSCVAMCGIVGERLIKDVLRNSVLIEKDGKNQHPSDAAFDQLEHVEVYGIVNFLDKAGLLGNDAVTAARKLGDLRNAYSHARGKDPEKDALDAIIFLHKIVDDTVSIFKGFDLQHGVMMIRNPHLQGGVMRGGLTKPK